MSLDADTVALHLSRLLDQKGAEDLTVLRVDPASGALFDVAIIATGRSERQLNTFVQEALHFCKRQSLSYRPPEGAEGWHLIDCADVIVHAMLAEARAYYRLEALWPGAEVIDYAGLIANLPLLPGEAAAMERQRDPFDMTKPTNE